MGILLLHGLGGDRGQPLSLLSPVLPQGARVLAPDIRAHGASPLIGRPADFSFDNLTAELAAAVREGGFDDEPLTIIGISLGAALGLRLALGGSVEIERMILLRPAFTEQSLPQHLSAFPVMGELLSRHPAGLAEALFRASGQFEKFEQVSPRAAVATLEQFRKPDAAARAVRLVEVPRNRAFSHESELAAIDVPTSIIAAPRDPVHPVAVAEQWHSALRQGSFTLLPARDDGLAEYTAATRAAVAAALTA